MYTVVAALVTVLAKRYANVLQALFDVVGITRACSIANATG
jgi:hypothetical protein